MKKLDSASTFEIKDNTERKWLVILEHLKNTKMGCLKFKATLILQNETFSNTSIYNAVYQFKGHYLNDYDEAKWILDYHIKETEKKC